MVRRVLPRFCALIALSLGSFAARGQEAPTPARLLNELALVRYSVTAEVNDTSAQVVLEQEFANPRNAWPEADFLFPLPDGAAASGLSLEMGGQYFGGNLLRSERARDIYREITNRRRDPALLECVGRDLYRCRVFPIAAGGTTGVRVAYRSALGISSGMRRFVLPLDGTRFSGRQAQAMEISIQLRSESVLQAIFCPTHEVSIERTAWNEARVRLLSRRAILAGNLVLEWSVEEAPLALLASSYRSPRGEGYFALSIDAAFAREEQRRAPRDVVLLLDTSSSAGREGVNRAAAAVGDAIASLRPGDRYALVAFATEPRPLLNFEEVGPDAANKVRRLLAEQPVAGRTRLEAALAEAGRIAGEGAPGTGIVLLSDGVTAGGPDDSSERAIDRARSLARAGHRVGTCGVGPEIDMLCLDAIGAAGEGDSAYATAGTPLAPSVEQLLESTRAVPLTDVRVEIDGVLQLHPTRLALFQQGDSLLLSGRYTRAGARRVRISARVGGQTIAREFEIELTARGGDAALARLWASRRVGALLEEAREAGDPMLHSAEIALLGRRYGIVTPHTSLLVLEEADQSHFLRGLARQPLLGRIEGGSPFMAPAIVTQERASRAELVTRLRKLTRCSSGAADPFGDLLGVNRERMRLLGDRTFYRQEDGSWVQAELLDAQGIGEIREVRFLSDAWWSLASEQSAALALGSDLLLEDSEGKAVRVRE